MARTRRLRLDAVNVTLRGYPPEEARRLADRLPAAIAFALNHPGQAEQGPAGETGRQVAARIRERTGEGR